MFLWGVLGSAAACGIAYLAGWWEELVEVVDGYTNFWLFVHPVIENDMTDVIPDPYFHPIVSAWISENTFDVKKRAITAATYNVIVQIGSLIGSQIYRAYDAPYYKRGNTVLISICALSLVVFLLQRFYLQILNKRKERLWSRMTVEERAAYQNDNEAREVDGNKRLDFRFKY